MVFMLSQGWRNKRVEYDMDLVDSTVKSLRSLANERRERYVESNFFFLIKKNSSSFICFLHRLIILLLTIALSFC